MDGVIASDFEKGNGSCFENSKKDHAYICYIDVS